MKTQFSLKSPIWNQLPKSIKQTDLFKPTSKKIKNDDNTANSMLTIKKLFIFFPKNFPNKHETTRFRKGKNKGNKYIEKKKK
jgi:hypothetical protein